jgi:AcrR family transcriptional regulator
MPDMSLTLPTLTSDTDLDDSTTAPGAAVGTAGQHDATTTPDRRVARRAQTEYALRQAALGLAEERGFDGFTVDEVAQHAGVSPRTFFNYFPTKEAALLADPRPMLDAMNAGFDAQIDAPLVDAILGAINGFLAAATVNPVDTRRELALIESQPPLRIALLSHYCAYERTLARAIAGRMGVGIEDDPLPLALAASAVAVARIVIVRWSWGTDEHPDPRDVESTVRRMSSVLAI